MMTAEIIWIETTDSTYIDFLFFIDLEPEQMDNIFNEFLFSVQDWLKPGHPFADNPLTERPSKENPMKIQQSPSKKRVKWSDEETETFVKVYIQWLSNNPSATSVECKCL